MTLKQLFFLALAIVVLYYLAPMIFAVIKWVLILAVIGIIAGVVIYFLWIANQKDKLKPGQR